MKKAMLIVLAILVMATLVVAQQDSSTAPATNKPNTNTNYSVDGYLFGNSPFGSHLQHGCMLCHAPHSANGTISSAAVTPVGGTFPLAEFGPSYTGSTAITSINTGFSGGAVAGSIYLWGTALTQQTYTTWEGTTINATGVNKNSAVVHTLLCMSCHDNANSSYSMGAGYGNAPGTELGTGNTVVDSYQDHIGLSTIINPSGPAVWNPQSSLNNSHPVDVQYTGLVANGEWKINIANGEATFNDPNFNLDGTNLGHPAKLWVDGVSGNAMVECTSCHDPHRETVFAYWNGTKYVIGTQGSTIYYLRGPYSNPEALSGPGAGNSGITNANFCRSCHYDKSEAYANANGGAQ